MKGLISLFSISLLFTLSLISDKATAASVNSKQVDSSYYRHIMFRESPYATYRGIHPVKSDSNPDFAHYEFKQDQQGRVTQISYQVDNALIRGNEVWDSYIWFAPKVKIAYSSGQETHTYFDVNNQQIEAHGKVYRAVYALDEKGKRQGLTFFDKQGQPSENAWNVNRYEWRHADGKVYEKRFNLKGEQQPFRPVLKFYEVELEYDADGKLAFMRNLGLDGVPTNNDSGAGIDRIVYDQFGNFVRWQVYDKDGLAIEGNRPMVHMGEHLYDHLGNKVGLRGYDRSGKRIPFSWGAFEHVRTFNKQGNQDEHQIFDENGVLTRHLLIEYSQDHSEISWLKSLDKQRNLIASPMLGGAAAMKYVYGEEGKLTREFYNADLTLYQAPTQGSSN